MSLPPIAALPFYHLPQSLTLPPITNSPSVSSSPPVRTPRTNSSPQSSAGWYSASPPSRSSKSYRQSFALPSFRDAFPSVDNDVLPVFRPKTIVSHPDVFFSDSEEEHMECPKSLIYDEEEDRFTPRRGARSTFFDVSSERGQGPSEPHLWQHSSRLLLKRVSAPSNTLPTVAAPTPPLRTNSEPAPSESEFLPPATSSSPVKSTFADPVPETGIPPSSPPPSSPVPSQVTPTSPPLSPVSASSASTLLRTVSPLTLPPSSPKISSSTDSEWELEIKVEACTPMTSEDKVAVAEAATPRGLSPSPPSDELDTTIRCETTFDTEVDQPPVPLRPPTLSCERSDLLTAAIQEPSLTIAKDQGVPPQPAPLLEVKAEISEDPIPASTPAHAEEPSSPLKRKEEEDYEDESECERPRKKRARRAPAESPAPKRRRRARKSMSVPKAKQRYKSAAIVHDEDEDEPEELVHTNSKRQTNRCRRRSSVTSIASCSSLSSVEEDDNDHPSEPLPKVPKKAAKPSSNPELMGLIIECFATSRASSLAPSSIYRTLTASRPQLKAEKSKEEWMETIETVLEEGWDGTDGVFGRIDSSGKDDADRPLEARWFYSPENDYDQDRAALVKSMMPRPAKRNVTKNYKQYYYQPLGKMSRWDPEDAL